MFGKDLESEYLQTNSKLFPKKPKQNTNIYFDDNTIGLIPRVIFELFKKVSNNLD